MSTNALAELEPDDKIAKRAEYEAFEFELEAPGLVRVTNGSHADPDDHSYLVDVEGGAPTACECPAAEYHGFPCKHAVAVMIRAPVLQAASERTVAPDGGRKQCHECGGWLPDEIEEGAGVYCPRCGHGQHVPDGGTVADDADGLEQCANEEQRPADCACTPTVDAESGEEIGALPCWPCTREGFETVNPEFPGVVK